MCTWVWIQNDVQKGSQLHGYQDALIKGVFQYKNPKTFIREARRPTRVQSWDGRVRGYFSYDTLNKLAAQIGILGPLGAILGRDIEQEIMLMRNTNYLSEMVINRSANAAPHSIKTQNFYDFPADAEENANEKNQGQAENSTGRNQGQAESSTSRRPGRDTR